MTVSDFNHILDQIKDNPIVVEKNKNIINENTVDPIKTHFDERVNKGKPFDINLFADELRDISEVKNKAYAELSGNITGYSIAHDCILNTVKKLLNHPVQSFSDKWLPIIMRSELGSAAHTVLQSNTTQFTEIERSLKVPSIRFSGRLDALIGNNVLVEIKSCTYSDYQKIIKKQQPRTPDFYQAMTYKYIIENHLDEAKNPGVPIRSEPPMLDKYEIDTIQFIYIAHDICSSDIEDLGQALKAISEFKKTVNSKYNKFFFMTSVVLDVNCFDQTPFIDYIKNKISAINYYVDNNKLPTKEDPFIDTGKCFYCLYYGNCELRLNKNS